jgi:hypothetical protein
MTFIGIGRNKNAQQAEKKAQQKANVGKYIRYLDNHFHIIETKDGTLAMHIPDGTYAQ